VILNVNGKWLELGLYDCRVLLSLLTLKSKTPAKIAEEWKDSNRTLYRKACEKLYRTQIHIFTTPRKKIRLLRRNKLSKGTVIKSKYGYSLKEETIISMVLSRYPGELSTKDEKKAQDRLYTLITDHLQHVYISKINSRAFWYMGETRKKKAQYLLEDLLDYFFTAIFNIELKR